MAHFKKPMGALFQHLTYDNFFLRMQNNDLNNAIQTLEKNISELNRFIMSQYDLSFNIIENLRIVTFDNSGGVISCIHSDASGNFVACSDVSSGYLPCVLPPFMQSMDYPDKKKVSKTHISDASRCFPYDYPYYPYYGYGYPYYPYLNDDDYYYRGMDLSGVKLPVHPPTNMPVHPPTNMPVHPPTNMPVHPSMVHAPPITHIHIHNK